MAIKRDWVKKKAPNCSNCGTQLPHRSLPEGSTCTNQNQSPDGWRSATLSHRPPKEAGLCDVTSSQAYLSSGEWSNCYSEAFRRRRKKVSGNVKQTPRKSSAPLVPRAYCPYTGSCRLLQWKKLDFFPYLKAAAQNQFSSHGTVNMSIYLTAIIWKMQTKQATHLI